jgi:hypothetical protein
MTALDELLARLQLEQEECERAAQRCEAEAAQHRRQAELVAAQITGLRLARELINGQGDERKPRRRDIRGLVAEMIKQEPQITAEEIAGRIGCRPVQVRKALIT